MIRLKYKSNIFSSEICQLIFIHSLDVFLMEDDFSFRWFSLDMTYFEHNNKHYLIWAEIIGDSSLFMAEINPEEPNQLISSPILLTKPEYDWENIHAHKQWIIKENGIVYHY